jgi:PAS domain S-box-containing protein
LTRNRSGTATARALDSTSLRDRLEELRAVVPEVTARAEPGSNDLLVFELIDLLEHKQRHLIQENVRLAGLRELTEALLRDPEEERVLRTISLYLRKAHGLPEVLVLSKGDSGGLRGYRARAGADGLCEAVRWTAEAIRGTAWQRALDGETMRRAEVAKPPSGSPAPLPWILPLRVSSDQDHAFPEDVGPGGLVLGLLALRPDETTGTGVDALEVEQLAFQTATLLASVRHQQKALQDRRFRECLLEAMEDGLIATDGAGRITAANRAALTLLGLEGPPSLGDPLESLREISPQMVTIGRTCLEKRSPIRHQEVWIQTGKTRIPANLSVVPLEETTEDGGGIVATLSDLRPLRAMEEELRRLDRLAALGRFAAAVAHEIRNPLAAIGAGVDFLGSSLSEEKQSDVERLRSEVARLNRIVTDLLVPARTQPLETRAVPVAELVDRACQAVEPMAREKGVRVDLGPSAPSRGFTIDVDADRLLQVLLNLVRNAVEASAAGQAVEIGWELDETGSRPLARIWVRDHGAGIAQQHIPHIFEPFYSTKAGGTGLGLYVSHSVVEQHSGKLTVESSPGEGTTFTMNLPQPPRA